MMSIRFIVGKCKMFQFGSIRGGSHWEMFELPKAIKWDNTIGVVFEVFHLSKFDW